VSQFEKISVARLLMTKELSAGVEFVNSTPMLALVMTTSSPFVGITLPDQFASTNQSFVPEDGIHVRVADHPVLPNKASATGRAIRKLSRFLAMIRPFFLFSLLASSAQRI
jgi:hypothetical protein